MTFNICTLLAPAAVIFLTACGGGGGAPAQMTPIVTPPGVVVPPSTTPEQTAGPASERINDLLAFAADGTTSVSSTGIQRQSRSFVGENNQQGIVVVDTLSGSDAGLVQYRLGNDVFVYSTLGDAVAVADLPSGLYVGSIDINYTLDSMTAPDIMSGEFSVMLDMATGIARTNSFAFNDKHSIEVFADAVVGAEFSDMTTDTAIANIRDQQNGGVFLRSETVSVNAQGAANDNGSAIFGVVNGENSANGFSMNGGFTVTLQD